MSLVDELERLKQLYISGALSDDEFDAAKQRLLQERQRPPVRRNSVGRAANRYVNYQMIAGAVGLVLFLVVLFTVILPTMTKTRAPAPPPTSVAPVVTYTYPEVAPGPTVTITEVTPEPR
nr:SHOCT domain-containing protein [Kibdelosporangium sp. MJ126-NF4]CEL22962.1 hypothetical protein [Kibdelosporangium sp. MJ126-NF4]CTQ90101.1 hypothetical protein [Kibdelosporangium sp. MJ126-NF4]